LQRPPSIPSRRRYIAKASTRDLLLPQPQTDTQQEYAAGAQGQGHGMEMTGMVARTPGAGGGYDGGHVDEYEYEDDYDDWEEDPGQYAPTQQQQHNASRVTITQRATPEQQSRSQMHVQQDLMDDRGRGPALAVAPTARATVAATARLWV
jgi:hypothetical protein